VPDSLKEKRKAYNDVRKKIKKALAEGPKTIPQIATETGIPSHIITYTLMTCRKYGEIETGEPDDMDEYYYYQLKQK
jgi:predicted transcriptional regulator